MRSAVYVLSGAASILLACALRADPPDPAKSKKDDATALHGTWVVESQLENGEKSDLGDRRLELEIKDKRAVIRINDVKIEAELRLDPATTPKIIDFELIPPDGAQKQQLEGIYELDAKGRLRICVKQPGPMRERPTEFESKAGSNTVLLTLKRKEG
jgi:uncharacterized protein (TIGR03067 family)